MSVRVRAVWRGGPLHRRAGALLAEMGSTLLRSGRSTSHRPTGPFPVPTGEQGSAKITLILSGCSWRSRRARRGKVRRAISDNRLKEIIGEPTDEQPHLDIAALRDRDHPPQEKRWQPTHRDIRVARERSQNCAHCAQCAQCSGGRGKRDDRLRHNTPHCARRIRGWRRKRAQWAQWAQFHGLFPGDR